MGREVNKKGQVTIFIIVGIVIVVAVILLFYFYSDRILGPSPELYGEPEENVESCLKLVLEDAIEKVANANGYLHSYPDESLEYLNETVPYLCYTQNNYARCNTQEAFFIRHVEEEIRKESEAGMLKCFSDLKRNVEESRYNIEMREIEDYSINLIPNEAKLSVRRNIVIRKEGTYEEYELFEVNLRSPIYYMSFIAQEIARQESLYCNSEYVEMVRRYQDFKIRKAQLGNDPKVYTIESTINGQKMMIGVRGCVLNVPR